MCTDEHVCVCVSVRADLVCVCVCVCVCVRADLVCVPDERAAPVDHLVEDVSKGARVHPVVHAQPDDVLRDVVCGTTAHARHVRSRIGREDGPQTTMTNGSDLLVAT